MKSKSILATSKAGVRFLTAPVRRCLTDVRINKMQRGLDLLPNPSRFFLDLTEKAEQICREVKTDTVLGDYFIKNNPWSGRAWRKFNYWNGWYALTRQIQPASVLEIGTAFGFSTMALARGAGKSLNLLVSLDLGNFGKLFSKEESPVKDNLFFVKNGIELYKKENKLDFEYLQFAVNTQPPPYTDNEGNTVACPYWKDNQELKALLAGTKFDVVLVDGKHTEDGLYNDVQSFFPYVKSGGLIICDDIQHADAAASLSRFIKENKDIASYYVWHFLRSDSQYGGTLRRDQGLLLKK